MCNVCELESCCAIRCLIVEGERILSLAYVVAKVKSAPVCVCVVPFSTNMLERSHELRFIMVVRECMCERE